MADILDAATDIVLAAERGEILRRVEALLEKYPDGLLMFVVSGICDGMFTTEVATNAKPEFILWMVSSVTGAIMDGALGDIG